MINAVNTNIYPDVTIYLNVELYLNRVGLEEYCLGQILLS